MMKSYLRYEPRKTFGIVASPSSNAIFDFSGNMAITGGTQDVSVWNLRQAQKISTFVDKGMYNNYPFGELGEVTVLARSPDKCTVAVGYSTGDVRIFNYLTNSQVATLRGHRSAVTSLVYDTPIDISSKHEGLTLISGGADTDIYVWDLVGMQAQARLRGHHDAVTGLVVLRRRGPSANFLVVSTSKDTQMKVWDISTRVCIQTVLGHRSEIWSVCLVPHGVDGESPVIITGTADDQLRGYRLNPSLRTGRKDAADISNAMEALDDEENVLEFCGCIARSGNRGNDRVSAIICSANSRLLAAQTSGRTIHFYRIRSYAQAKGHRKRALKKARLRAAREGDAWVEDDVVTRENSDGDSTDEEDDESIGGADKLELQDILEAQSPLRCSVKVRSCAFSPVAAKADGEERILVSLLSNCLEMYKVPAVKAQMSASESVPAKTMLLDMQGHRSDVRAVAIGTDGSTVASCSTDGVKLWSVATQTCIRSCNSSVSGDVQGTCLAFAPGGRLLVLGTKVGTCDIIDTASGMCIQSIPKAHRSFENSEASQNENGESSENGAAIWTVAMRPDGRGFSTGGADKFVKFWEFQGEEEEEEGFAKNDFLSKDTLYAKLEKQLKMESDVLCLCYNHQVSKDKLIVAIGLLDNTIKLFFEDTMKFFLSLYGHKLPVLAIDISHDSKLLISGAADKTIKIWGLDFGDCHRSLVGHTDSITSLRFQHNTHYFFSGSKDGSLKYWDADRFEQVLHLPGHKGSVWGVDVSRDGAYCVSSGQDRSLRIWERTEDLVFVEEERERAIVAQADASSIDVSHNKDDSGAEKVTYVDTTQSTGRKSLESIRSGEILIDAVDMVEAELADIADYSQRLLSTKHVRLAPRAANVQLLGLEPLSYLLRCLKMIKLPDLEQTLLILPFHYVIRLIKLIVVMCERGIYDVELCCRCAVFLLRCHQPQIVTTRSLIPEIKKLQEVVRLHMGSLRDLIGTNLAGLHHMKRALEQESMQQLGIDGNEWTRKKKKG